MTKNTVKVRKRDSGNAQTIKETAGICGVSVRQVRRVMSGDSENEFVLNTYMELSEGKNKLLEAVKELVPFLNPKISGQ